MMFRDGGFLRVCQISDKKVKNGNLPKFNFHHDTRKNIIATILFGVPNVRHMKFRSGK
jgi:hypothetical protein